MSSAPVTSAVGSLGQEGYGFQASLGYVMVCVWLAPGGDSPNWSLFLGPKLVLPLQDLPQLTLENYEFWPDVIWMPKQQIDAERRTNLYKN